MAPSLDRRNDVWGARDAGIAALHFGLEIDSFEEIAKLLLTPQNGVSRIASPNSAAASDRTEDGVPVDPTWLFTEPRTTPV